MVNLYAIIFLIICKKLNSRLWTCLNFVDYLGLFRILAIFDLIPLKPKIKGLSISESF